MDLSFLLFPGGIKKKNEPQVDSLAAIKENPFSALRTGEDKDKDSEMLRHSDSNPDPESEHLHLPSKATPVKRVHTKEMVYSHDPFAFDQEEECSSPVPVPNSDSSNSNKKLENKDTKNKKDSVSSNKATENKKASVCSNNNSGCGIHWWIPVCIIVVGLIVRVGLSGTEGARE